MIAFYKAHTFSTNTKRSYGVHLRQYLQFCFRFNYPPIPASTTVLCRYAVFLSKSLAASSIRQYLNIVSLLHKDNGLPNPIIDNWSLKMVLKGIVKVKGQSVKRKLPIDPQLLLLLRSKLDLTDPVNVVFWSVCLTMFFGLLRKSNVLPPSLKGFISSKHLSRSDFRIHPKGLHHGILLVIRWSKTIQSQQKTLFIPLPYIHNHALCPTTAAIKALALVPEAPLDAPAFLIPTQGQGFAPLLYGAFLGRLRSTLAKCNINPAEFAGHSFRRGGATWALLQGISTEVIKLMGDWNSNAYTAYLELPFHARYQAIQQFVNGLPANNVNTTF